MTAATATGGTRRSLAREFGASVLTIMVKELRSRFRGRRAFLVMTLYLGVLALIAYGAYTVVAPDARDRAALGGFDGITLSNVNASASVGQAIFSLLSVFQLLLVGFIAPAFTAGAISLEREKQTFDLLVTTPMRPGAIVVGKLVAALAFVALMIVAAIPISALVLMYGGASLEDIVRQQVVLFITAIGFGVIGLFFSALIKRTQTATVLTYSTLLALTIGTLLIWRFWSVVATNAEDNPFGQPRPAPEQLLYLNPAVAMIEIVANTEVNPGDFSAVMRMLRTGSEGTTICEGDICFNVEPEPLVRPAPAVDLPGNGAVGEEAGVICKGDVCVAAGGDEPLAAIGDTTSGVSDYFWPRISLSFGVLSLLLTLASMRLVVPAPMRWAFRRPARAEAFGTTALAAAGEPGIEEMDR
jgi:ABC-type transport system involved in multi-copper enzyme maturation permease subunit